MARDLFFCPLEECASNRNGYCSGNKRSLTAPTGMYDPGSGNFYGPYGPANAVLSNNVGAEGQPAMTPDWRDWRNCPHVHGKEV